MQILWLQRFSIVANFAIFPLKWRADLREQGAELSKLAGRWLG